MIRGYKKGSFCIALGLVLTVSAFLLAGYNDMLGRKAEKNSENILRELVQSYDTSSNIQNEDMEMPVKSIDGYDCIGTIEIPSLRVILPVLSEWDYNNFRISPCRYTGSVYQDNLIICAHNYKSHFGRIKALEVGDLVTFTDMNGNVFRFKVSDIETVNPDFPENMTDGTWDLTLFTCTVSGASRVTVRCVRER